MPRHGTTNHREPRPKDQQSRRALERGQGDKRAARSQNENQNRQLRALEDPKRKSRFGR